MRSILGTLTISLLLIIAASCGGGSKKVVAEAMAQAKKDSIEQAKKNELHPLQKKYATILEVSPKEIDNIPLFEFIEEWMETPYKMGGETKRGIDCSYFSQYLFHDVYGNLIERTAQKQFDAPDTKKFLGQKYLTEGDLIFFNENGSPNNPITHVGVYLGNNYFVHSTSRKSNTGKNGVQISNLKKRNWQKMFVAGGKKPKLTNSSASTSN